MEYYSAVKNKDILSFSGKWMELENIIQTEVIQIQKDMHGLYSYQPSMAALWEIQWASD